MEDEGELPELMMTSEHVGGSTGVKNMSGGNGSFFKYVVFLSYIYVKFDASNKKKTAKANLKFEMSLL